MKFQIGPVQSLKLALKQLEPLIRDGKSIQTGKPMEGFGGMLPREALANWLLCAVQNRSGADRYIFAFDASDPTGSDGIIWDTATGMTYPTEHVLIHTPHGNSIADDTSEALVLCAIQQKQAKGGAAYALGKTLVVFLNIAAGPYQPSWLVRNLPADIDFAAVYLVSSQEMNAGRYVFAVSQLNWHIQEAPTFRVVIAETFDDWKVEQLL